VINYRHASETLCFFPIRQPLYENQGANSFIVAGFVCLSAAEAEERKRNTEEEVFKPAKGDGRPEGGRAEAAGRDDEAASCHTRHGKRHRRS